MIVGHNVWSGSLLSLAVTLLGWLIFVKGLVLLLVPDSGLAQAFQQMHYDDHYYLYLVPSLAIGIYLTWAGFATS